MSKFRFRDEGPVTGKQTAPASTTSELRQEARLILDRIGVTADREQKHRLAVRAFELVQLAEQLTHDTEQGQIHLHDPKVDQ